MLAIINTILYKGKIMNNIRLEKYPALINEFPFSLGIDIKRTPYNLSKEQNWHENLEIQLCTHGNGSVLLDGKEYPLNEDDILVVNSNVIHYTSTKTSLVYTCLIISTDWCRQMNINYDALYFYPQINNKKLVYLMKRLINIYTDYDNPLRIAKSNEILLRIMIEMIEKHSEEKKYLYQKGNHFDIIKSTVTYIHRNFNKRMTLKEISEAVCYDKFALCKEFKKYTGNTIIEYINQYRTTKAIDYLGDGFNVTETASLCGFDNLSFFTKVFKRYTGNNPSYYKK